MKNLDMKIARVKKNMRQMDITLVTGIPASLLSLYESGLKAPSAVHAKLINNVLGQSIFLVEDSEVRNEETKARS
jgi:transcriptional regulator with XRE-family HTH domain